MSTATRKQREIQQREAQILDVSRPMLLKEGYHGLSMDRIAAALEYAKGTIYNHFSCKEEIIIALANETMEKRTAMFQRAAQFRGTSRERIMAIAVAAETFVRLYPEHFGVEQLIRSASLWEKTSHERRANMRSCETRCMGIVSGIVRDAVANDDLTLPPQFTPEDLVFGMWSLSFGAYSIISTSDSLAELGISDPFLTVREHMSRVLDGFGWKPISSAHDYGAVAQRINQEVFPDESRQAMAG